MSEIHKPLVWVNELSEIKSRKSCELCIHKKVCKFLSNAKKALQTNEMFEMQEHAIHHNALRAFEQFASCSHYETFLFDRDMFTKYSKDYLSQFQNMDKLKDAYIEEVILPKHKDFIERKIKEFRSTNKYDGVGDDRIHKFTYDRGLTNNISYVKIDGTRYDFTYKEVFEHFGAFEKK